MRCKEDLLRLRREMMKASVVLIALCASSVHAFIGVGVRPDGQTTIRSQSCTREVSATPYGRLSVSNASLSDILSRTRNDHEELAKRLMQGRGSLMLVLV